VSRETREVRLHDVVRAINVVLQESKARLRGLRFHGHLSCRTCHYVQHECRASGAKATLLSILGFSMSIKKSLAVSIWNSSQILRPSTLPIAHSNHLSMAEAISRYLCVKSGKRFNRNDALFLKYLGVNFVTK